ncbi:hypothetical protein EPT61_05100 [Pediococcus pentosaceus]|uniref:SemiSWEET family transporter n=1 Tax=Pediococcus pentosaceus TaxID=1255 RepID=UPI001008AA19|nr:SemiSWEET family transporter [Pediococcus pentosaceus]RXI21806.1 hypothetical protein EPT61_05100 [Pediococcus pentosaceus]
MQEETKVICIIGRLASVMSVLMYVSYIPQIISNLHGNYGDPIQPLVVGVNCTTWVIYGYFKADRDWPIIMANIPGVFLGFYTFYTALH